MGSKVCAHRGSFEEKLSQKVPFRTSHSTPFFRYFQGLTKVF